MKKIAITAESPDLDDPVDPRFGRAAGFVVIDSESENSRYLDNGVSQTMARGAGIQAAEIVARAGAGVLLTGYVGPKAFQALGAAGIEVVQNVENMSVREALARYKQGGFKTSSAPLSQGHGR